MDYNGVIYIYNIYTQFDIYGYIWDMGYDWGYF